MCVWKVDESERKCEYCSYRGGCEEYEKVTPVWEASSNYVEILSGLLGRNILERSRERMMVCARYLACYRLVLDGYSLTQVGKTLGLDHSTVLHGRKCVENMLKMPQMYPDEVKLWGKFTDLLSLPKK